VRHETELVFAQLAPLSTPMRSINRHLSTARSFIPFQHDLVAFARRSGDLWVSHYFWVRTGTGCNSCHFDRSGEISCCFFPI